MSVIRVHKNKNFTIMSNIHLRDKNLSLKAKGLLSVMLSLPDDWNYSIAGLCAICKENETAVKSALNELKLNRYVIVSKKLPNETDNGRLKYEYEVYEEPQFEIKQDIEKQKIQKQQIQKQGIENLGVELQEIEKQGQLNINISTTKKFNSTFSRQKKEVSKKIYSLKEQKSRIDEMIKRAEKISYDELHMERVQSENVVCCIRYFIEQYYRLTGNFHPVLTNETLKMIIERFTKKYKDDWGHTILSLASDIDGNEEYKEIIDHYFTVKFDKVTNYNLPHFASERILKNIMYHVRNYI